MTPIRTQPTSDTVSQRRLSRIVFGPTMAQTMLVGLERYLSPVTFMKLKTWRFIALLLLIFGNVTPSQAQGSSFWAPQERIPEYLDSTEEPPYLIADMNRTVHAFNAQPLDLNDAAGPRAIFYRQWTIDNGWTYPNDILYDIDGYSLYLVGATSDATGHVHLLIQKNGDIYYVQNYLSLANNAASWPVPVVIAGNTTGFGPGYEIISAIATNPTGDKIVVVYSGRQYGNGLYFTSSSDSGATWSEPYPIYLTGDDQILVTDAKLYMGESGLAHAVWSTFLDTGAGGPGYYANFNTETESWSEPMELDVPGIRTPSVIEWQGNVFVRYYHANVNGNWWRKSSDGGKTWSFPEQFSPRHVGTNGNVSFAVDGGNVLHAFFGERIDDRNHGIWHLTFNGTTWGGIEAVVRGPQVRDRTGGKGFDPRSARAVIVNGNVALVTWGTDGFAGPNGAWFSYKRLNALELPTQISEAPTSIPLSTPTFELPNTPTVTAVEPGLDLQAESPEFAQSPQTSILVGVVPVLLLLLGIVLIYYIVQYRSK